MEEEKKVHHEPHLHEEAHAHHPGHQARTAPGQMPWMMVSILLAVLLLVSLYMNYSLVKSVLSQEKAQAAPTGGAVTPPPAAPAAPEAPAKAEVKLTDADHLLGSKDAKVVIVEYSDFQCPFCGRAEPTIEEVIKKYGKDVVLVYRHFPLSFHENARPAALASECAGEQNKFWEFHNVLYKNQQALTETDLLKYAKDLKLDETKFTSCMKTEKYAGKIDADFAQGQKEGVQGTPAFFINGQLLSGAQPFANFKAMIDAELA